MEERNLRKHGVLSLQRTQQGRRDGRRPGRVGHHRGRRENGNRSQDRGGADEGGHGVTTASSAALVRCECRKTALSVFSPGFTPNVSNQESASLMRLCEVEASELPRDTGAEWSSNWRSCDWLDDILPETVRSADSKHTTTCFTYTTCSPHRIRSKRIRLQHRAGTNQLLANWQLSGRLSKQPMSPETVISPSTSTPPCQSSRP